MKIGKWQVGDKLDNRYEIYQIVAGGMGIIYVCYDHESKTPCVLKTFQDRYLFSEETQKLFEREALIWTELERYPYIVRAYWVDRLEGRLFIVLEYIAPDHQGRNSLSHYLGNLSLSETLKFAIQCCYGMEYAYSRGIDAHRDIKPDNIMITADQTAKITDFGLTRAFQEMQFREQEVASSENLTQSPRLSIFRSKGKGICGTLPYMAPEQFDGYADKRSDIYSFGIVLYQMVTDGRFPFVGETQEEYERLHRYGKIASISSPLFPIISQCLAKEPNRRFQDFVLIREELQKILFKTTGERLVPPKIEELKDWELSNKGTAFGNLGRHEEEIKCYDEALRINPKYAEAWSNKGLALGNLGQHEEAIRCHDEALRINPKYAEAWSNRGLALGNLGRHEEEIKCYDEALRINPRYAAAWSNKGLALDSLGRHEEAIRCHDEALRINPRFTAAWSNKGLALDNLGRYEEAIKCHDEALRLNPRFTTAWYNKGLALDSLGRHEEAIRCHDGALLINPRFTTAWFSKGFALDGLGRHEEAIRCYDEALLINPRFLDAWYNKGVAFGNLGQYDDAIKCCNEVLRINPRFVDAWYNKGVALAKLARNEEALRCYDEVLRIKPSNAGVWLNKGIALFVLGQHNEALKCVEEAIILNPNDTETLKLKQMILEKLWK
jgi:tetratricopeptide (TPR) repeat protein